MAESDCRRTLSKSTNNGYKRPIEEQGVKRQWRGDMNGQYLHHQTSTKTHSVARYLESRGARASPTIPDTPQPSSITMELESITAFFRRTFCGEAIHSPNNGVIFQTTALVLDQMIEYARTAEADLPL